MCNMMMRRGLLEESMRHQYISAENTETEMKPEKTVIAAGTPVRTGLSLRLGFRVCYLF